MTSARLRRIYGRKDPAEEFLRAAAEKEGLTYHEWCKKYGVIDRAAAEREERHAAAVSPEWSERLLHEKAGEVRHLSEGNQWHIGPDAWADDLNSIDDALEDWRSPR